MKTVIFLLQYESIIIIIILSTSTILAAKLEYLDKNYTVSKKLD